MYVVEDRSDTLLQEEQRFLLTIAVADYPDHEFSVQSNEDGLAWVVFEPRADRPGLLRITICRVDPSVMVMIEGNGSPRRIHSAPDLETAAAIVRELTDQAFLHSVNAHPRSPVLQ